jgi:hypothetical protein
MIPADKPETQPSQKAKGDTTMLNLKSIGSYLVMILLVMLGIWAVKKAATKWNIPVVSAVAAEV